MIQAIVLSVFCFLLTCAGQGSEQTAQTTRKETYQWRKVLDQGPWPKNYNFQMFSHRDTLWVFHPDGNWYSRDGIKWTKSALPNALQNLAFLDYVQFDGSIYGLGRFEGNIEKFSFKPLIYRSENMKSWTARPSASLPPRFFYHPFVFDKKIWIVGGEDKSRQYDDLWNSADGINWVKQKEKLPFGKRSGSQVVQLGSALFLLNNDVWRSSDALGWQKVSSEIVKGQTLFGYTALAFDGKVWLLGCTRNGQFTSRVLYSTDGKTWTEQDAPWSHRGGVAACVHRGKVYMTGGKFGGNDINHPEFIYSNDLWVLEKK